MSKQKLCKKKRTYSDTNFTMALLTCSPTVTNACTV